MTSIPDTEIIGKSCSKCGVYKTLEHFYAKKSGKLGRESQCKDCRFPNRTVVPFEPEGYKQCSKCKVIKLLKEFHKHKGRRLGRVARCKACVAEAWRAYYSKEENRIRRIEYDQEYFSKPENRDRRSETTRIWWEENPEKRRTYSHERRVKIRGGESDNHTESQVIAQYGEHCIYCGVRVAVGGKRISGMFTKEHVLPVDLGGDNTLDNVRPSCGSCNSSKGAKRLIEYLAWREPEPDPTDTDVETYMLECRELDSGMICVGYSAQ